MDEIFLRVDKGKLFQIELKQHGITIEKPHKTDDRINKLCG